MLAPVGESLSGLVLFLIRKWGYNGMKKMEIERKLYSVVTPTEYTENIDLYNPHSTALEVAGRVLPVRNPMIDTGPGVYYEPGKMVADVIKPSPNHESEYSAERIIDLSKPKDIGEIIEKNELIRNIQNDLMVSGKDNIFYLNISQQDTPEMRALKTAINAKQVDKKAYEDRFDQFQNDMRLLKGNSITLAKMIGICNGFDIACTITLKDKPDSVNPMGTEITVDLTEGRPNKNEPA